jgi:signal transduction histidine kinase
VRIFWKSSGPGAGAADPPPAAHAEKRPFPLKEVRILAICILLAGAWITLSEMLLERLIGGAGRDWFRYSLQDVNIMVVTGLLLYLVVRRAHRGWQSAENKLLDEAQAESEEFRGLSARIQALREEERTRISRELHDELGQRLTGIKLQLRLIENQIDGRDDRSLNPVIDQLVEAGESVDDALHEMRRISMNLRPMSLDDLGLASALRDEAAEFSRKSGILCGMSMAQPGLRLPGEVETAVFRIFQESLTNIARHSGASRVDACCGIEDHSLVLRVRDNGRGMDPAPLGNRPSLGLRGMHERAAGVGGRIEFNAPPPHGTEVVLTIPLEATADPSPTPDPPP